MPNQSGRPRKALLIASDAMPEAPAYYTVPEAAALTHSHVRTIQARLRDGTLKGKKLGGVWRIYPEALTSGEMQQSAAKRSAPTPYEKVGADLNIEKR